MDSIYGSSRDDLFSDDLPPESVISENVDVHSAGGTTTEARPSMPYSDIPPGSDTPMAAAPDAHAMRSAAETGTSTTMPPEPGPTFHDLVRALMSDDDPDRIIFCMEVQSFCSFMNMMIDKLLHNGLLFHRFQPALDSKLAFMRTAGYPDLANAITDDLNRLGLDLQKLQEMRFAGVSSYVADHLELHLEAWRDARLSNEIEVQMQQGRVDQVKTALAEKSISLNNIHSLITSSEEEISQLKQELQAKEENLSILQLTRATEEAAQTILSNKLELSEQKLINIKENAAQMLNATEESFKVELEEELHHTYNNELSQLEQKILSRKFNV